MLLGATSCLCLKGVRGRLACKLQRGQNSCRVNSSPLHPHLRNFPDYCDTHYGSGDCGGLLQEEDKHLYCSSSARKHLPLNVEEPFCKWKILMLCWGGGLYFTCTATHTVICKSPHFAQGGV